jgi:hypothetical protein
MNVLLREKPGEDNLGVEGMLILGVGRLTLAGGLLNREFPPALGVIIRLL